MSKINIVLDIDDTLLSGFYTEFSFNKYEFKEFFEENNLVLKPQADGKFIPHIILPGVVEFIQYLYSNPNIEVSFYSSSSHTKMNEERAHLLLQRALGDKYTAVKDRVKIFSGKDCPESNDLLNRELYKNYKLYAGDYKKDLKKVLGPGDTLEQTLLFEDDATYIQCGQVKNVLLVRGCGENSFHSIKTSGATLNSIDNSIDGDYCRAANHAFYMTGMLDTVFKTAAEKKQSLADALFNIQWKPKERENTYECKRYELYKEMSYYEAGLKILQQFNSKLSFVTAETLVPVISSTAKQRLTA